MVTKMKATLEKFNNRLNQSEEIIIKRKGNYPILTHQGSKGKKKEQGEIKG